MKTESDTRAAVSAPPSGLWKGSTRPVTLARQGSCGERVRGRSAKAEPLWAVLFFDEDAVWGHATQAGQTLTVRGWWGPARHLRPVVDELEETELWETGDPGFHLRIGRGDVEETCFAWLRRGVIAGYGRRQGG